MKNDTKSEAMATTRRVSGMRNRFGWRLGARLGLVAALGAGVGLTARGDLPGVPEPPAPGQLAAAAETIKQTEAEAVVTAKATGRAIEVGAFRGERREVWANPDGTFTENTYLQPVRTVKDHKWVSPDPSLERNADGSVAPRAATYGLRLSGGGTGPLLTAERAGRSMSLSWPGGSLPAPTIIGDTATYSDVAPGLDMVVNVGVETFSHVLVVKSPEAARRPEVTSLALGLNGKGIKLTAAADGRLAAVDSATGARVFEAPAPVMWDSGDPVAEGRMAQQMGEQPEAPSRVAPASSRKAKLGVRLGAGKLHLTPDQSMLTDPQVRWPLYIDPVWSSTTTTFWAMVDSGYADTEYPKFDGAFQTKSDERAGYCPPDPNCNSSKIKRLMYRLPTSYAGKTIISAEFQVSLLRGWNTTARNISLYRMGADIGSSTNWNNQPAWTRLQQTKALGAEQSCSSTTRNSIFNATEAVQYAVANGKTTTVFGLRAENEGNNQYWKRFCENALLKVNWNRAPSQPAAADLQMSPGGACVFGSGRPYTDTRPVLKATLRDVDHLAVAGDAENLRAEFRVQWTPPGGTLQTVTWQSGYQASGTPFGWSYNTVGLTFPQNVTVSWDVRAFDGTTWGGWSSDGAANPCEFVYDNTTPSPPMVSSPEFLDDQLVDCGTYSDATWRDGVGVYTTFTFDSAATDVVEYQYGINTNPSPSNVLRPSVDGGPVQLTWLAERDGPNFVSVQAVDRASKHSAIATCTFRVSAGAQAVGEWSLGDEPDATEAADGRGGNSAVKNGDVTFGVDGPGGTADKAVRLTGADAYLATSSTGLVDTSRSFAVSAYVKLADTSRKQVAVSQDGSGEPGFTLGFDAAAGKWSFAIPVTDVDSLGEWKVTGGAPQVGVWAHLLGVYNAQTRTIALYVDGQATATAARRSAWKSRGGVQIGRRLAKSGHTDYFNGDLAKVALFNRVVVSGEAGLLAALKPARKGYWPLNEAPGGSAPNGVAGGQPLTLAGGAAVTVEDPLGDPPVIPMMGTGELYLDGVDDYASTGSQVVATDGSFTATARVRLASPDAGPEMAVLSQKGANKASGFIVRRSAANRWELALPASDAQGAVETTASDDQAPPTGEQQGQLLALVYNALTNEARLYVDGQLADSATATNVTAWNATGGLQVGRVFIDGTWQQYLAGSVDEVRVYSGVLDQTTVQQLNQLIELPDL
jgi:hypothetical protein